MGGWGQRWSSNPEGNYVMIEPNLKFMLYSAHARANPPLAWYERPPPRPRKSLPVDELRFLPCRRLQNAYSDVPWKQTVGDDLDSFTQLMLHTMIFRAQKRGDGFAHGIAGYYRALGKENPKALQDWRDSMENQLWIMGEEVKKARAAGVPEPEEACLAKVAEEVYRVTKVNVRHQCQERELAGKYKEGMEERARGQYEEYVGAMRTLQEAVEKMYAQEEEAKRAKAEDMARRKAEKRKEKDKESGDVEMDTAGAAEAEAAAGEESRVDERTGERPSKRARVE